MQDQSKIEERDICSSLEIHFHWRQVKHSDRRKEVIERRKEIDHRLIERRKEIDHFMNELIAMHELIAFGLIALGYLM